MPQATGQVVVEAAEVLKPPWPARGAGGAGGTPGGGRRGRRRCGRRGPQGRAHSVGAGFCVVNTYY